MNILVLGGNRYFGKSVLAKLLNKKNTVYLVNRNSKKIRIKDKNLIHICCDRSQLENFFFLFNGIIFDFVFDNIAYKLKDVKYLHKLLDKKFKHYIFTSSVMTYLDLSDRYDAKEIDWFKKKTTKDMLKSYAPSEIKYALNKIKIKKYLINNKKIKYTILRIHNVLGNDDFTKKTKKILSFDPKKFKNLKISKEDYIQFCFKDDLVKIIIKIIEKNKKNVSNIFNVANRKIKIINF